MVKTTVVHEQRAPAEVRAAAEDLLALVETLKDGLNDASSVVDAGNDEEYAYQAEIEAAEAALEKYDWLRRKVVLDAPPPAAR